MPAVRVTQERVVRNAVDPEQGKMATQSSDAAVNAVFFARSAAAEASVRATEASDALGIIHRRALHAAASAASAACAAAADATARAAAADEFVRAMQRVLCVVRASSQFSHHRAYANARARASRRVRHSVRNNRIQPVRHVQNNNAMNTHPQHK